MKVEWPRMLNRRVVEVAKGPKAEKLEISGYCIWSAALNFS